MDISYTPIDDLIHRDKQSGFVSKGKETEPYNSPSHEFEEMKEVVEHEPDEEVKNHVEVRKEAVEISEDLKKMGVQGTSPITFPSYQTIKLPLSDEKIITGLHAPFSSSIRWLATLAVYILRQSHITLKQVHGQIVRNLIKS